MPMRRLITLLAAAILAVVNARGLQAAEFKVIANPELGAVSATAAEIRAIFLETKTALADGRRVQPVVLRGAACEAFARTYLGKSATGLETYYRGLVFSGTGVIPKILNSEHDVIAYVARTRGAIGFISSTTQTGGLKIVTVRE